MPASMPMPKDKRKWKQGKKNTLKTKITLVNNLLWKPNLISNYWKVKLVL